MYLCIAGKNDIAVNAATHIIDNRLINKDKILITPNNTDNGKDSWQKSLKNYAIKNSLNIVKFNDIYSIQNLIFISLECDKLIKPYKFKTSRLYNLHFSNLPKYKGMYTSVIPILNGESVSGVTLHKIDEGIDTGDIIDQITFNISINDTARDLYFKYNKYAFELFKKNITNIIDDDIESFSQTNINSSYYSNQAIDFLNIEVDLNRTAYQIHNQLRAYIFKEYQLPKINNIKIIKSVLTNDKHNKANYVEEKIVVS